MADYRSTGKELRKSPKGFIALVLIGVLAISGALGVRNVLKDMTPVGANSSDTDSSSEEDIVIPDINDKSNSVEEPPQIIYSYDAVFRDALSEGALILVNREHSIEDNEDDLLCVYEKRNEHYTVKDMDVKLTKDCVTALNAMTTAFFNETGHEDLQIISGYRTKAYQKKLFDKDTADKNAPISDRVAEPGHSEHETGLAFDVNIYKKGVTEDFDGTGDYAWLAEHCAEYGFIVRYPEDKVEITKFSYEPWHFRYVGKAHAIYMRDHNLCLEEYLEEIKQYTYESEHLQTTDQFGFLCETFYVPAPEDTSAVIEIPVPAEQKFTVSGNNMDGFIVTVESNLFASDMADGTESSE